nr:AraC family transcriptional regulator [Pseudomonas brassicae]
MHDGLPGSAGGWQYRMLYLDPQWLNGAVFGGRPGSEHIHLFRQALTHDPAFARMFVQQHQAIEQSCSGLERESILLQLASQLFARCGGPQPVALASEREVVRRIRQVLDDGFDQSIALHELAQWVALDPLYLIRVFKKSVGVSPHSYQIQRRVAHVQQLLRSGVSIAEASLRCGFFDQSHMTRAFKKVVGVTPGSFRNG